MISELLRKRKRVAVWGLGYLGYTSILGLQEQGFGLRVFDLHEEPLRLFAEGKYPASRMAELWSESGYAPPVDYSRVEICRKPEEMFEGAAFHIVAIPLGYSPTEDRLSLLAKYFAKGVPAADGPQVVIFLSAHVPGNIDKHFIAQLEAQGIHDGEQILVGTAFRSDWVTEEYFRQQASQVVGANTPTALQAISDLYALLGRTVEPLPSIREAEVLENARRSFRFAATGFINQLSLCYQNVNMKRLSRLLLSGLNMEDCAPNMGAGGYKEPFAVQNLLEGADSAKYFTTLAEFQSVNYTMPVYYAQALLRRGVRSVAVLGLTFSANRRDLTLSPAVTFANYLLEQKVEVLVNDPLFSPEALADIVPGARPCSVQEALGQAGAVALMTNHRAYRALSEAFVLENIGSGLGIVLDNTGLWTRFQFPESVRYHEVGDGSLSLIA